MIGECHANHTDPNENDKKAERERRRRHDMDKARCKSASFLRDGIAALQTGNIDAARGVHARYQGSKRLDDVSASCAFIMIDVQLQPAQPADFTFLFVFRLLLEKRLALTLQQVKTLDATF